MKRTSQTPLKGNYDALGYNAATVARTEPKGVSAGGSGDYHLRYDRDTLLRQSNQFYRDNGLYEGVINRAADNIIGNGFSLLSRAKTKKVRQAVEELWRNFWQNESPEVRQMDSGYDCERFALTHMWVDGDFAALKTTLGLIQMVESERVGATFVKYFDRRVEDGVEVNKVGRPVGFWICDYDESFQQVRKASAVRYGADNVLFCANRKRVSQTRGVPVLVSNFPMFHRVNDVCDSEAVAWQLLARLAIIITREQAESKAFARSDNDTKDKTRPPDIADRIQDFDAGMIFHGEPGEKIAGVDRNLPGANFPASITMFIRLLGLPIGFPLELILLDWSKTNYSSARAALEQAFRMFTTWQRRLKMHFHTPIFFWKLQQWIDEGRLPNTPDIFKHEWITPSFPWIDQLKEAQAWGERIDRGLATQTDACKSLNQDREEWLVQRQMEVEEAIAAADAINAKNPKAMVDWRMFAGMGSQPTVKITEAEQAPNDAGAAAGAQGGNA